MWTELRAALTWVRAMVAQRTRPDEGGATAVEWLLILIAVIGIAGIAVVAVRHYVVNETGKLGSP